MPISVTLPRAAARQAGRTEGLAWGASGVASEKVMPCCTLVEPEKITPGTAETLEPDPRKPWETPWEKVWGGGAGGASTAVGYDEDDDDDDYPYDDDYDDDEEEIFDEFEEGDEEKDDEAEEPEDDDEL